MEDLRGAFSLTAAAPGSACPAEARGETQPLRDCCAAACGTGGPSRFGFPTPRDIPSGAGRFQRVLIRLVCARLPRVLAHSQQVRPVHERCEPRLVPAPGLGMNLSGERTAP